MNRPNGLSFQIPQALLDKWNPNLKIQAKGNVIEIFDVIGFDFFDEGITAKYVNDKLNELDGQDVEVLINSPGGDMFEGLAIYNLLKDYSRRY